MKTVSPLTRRDKATDRRSDEKPLVCVQGLGFVGAAMATAVANAKSEVGKPLFDVMGIDLPSEEGIARVNAINHGVFPFESGDPSLDRAVRDAHAEGNLRATTDEDWYRDASTVIVDVHCDVKSVDGRIEADLATLTTAVRTFGRLIQPGTLVIIETTVPPGSCARLVAPTLEECFRDRGLAPGSFFLAHSYERVMPGPDYYRSIVNFWRVFSGHTPEASDLCETFLSKVINIKDFPLTRLRSTTDSETAKVLENSYRAATIAFIDEWGRFAEVAGIDLFSVIDAIRVRPTHSNMRQPGLGVGGYCLTKDPLLGKFSSATLFGRNDLEFPFSTAAVETNNRMPIGSVDRLERMLGGELKGKRLLLLGVTYRPGVADTRYSPSAIFVREAETRDAEVTCYDPIISNWPEMARTVETRLPEPGTFDGIVFAVPNASYVALDLKAWLGAARPAILDTNNVLTGDQRNTFRALGCEVESVGRGSGL